MTASEFCDNQGIFLSQSSRLAAGLLCDISRGCLFSCAHQPAVQRQHLPEKEAQAYIIRAPVLAETRIPVDAHDRPLSVRTAVVMDAWRETLQSRPQGCDKPAGRVRIIPLIAMAGEKSGDRKWLAENLWLLTT